MIACPGCKAQLQDWAAKCQFCGADVSKVARVAQPTKRPVKSVAPGWVWMAYNALSVLFMLEGASGIFQTIRSTNEVMFGQKVGFSIFTYVAIAIHSLSILVGIGLLLQIRQVRDIVNFFLGLRIIFGLFGLAGLVMGSIVGGPLTLVFIFLQIVDLASAAFMIYLIGETDKVAPNI